LSRAAALGAWRSTLRSPAYRQITPILAQRILRENGNNIFSNLKPRALEQNKSCAIAAHIGYIVPHM
jgi:hypothetical protein